jgi:multiple sugar transport system substrate-binding protein
MKFKQPAFAHTTLLLLAVAIIFGLPACKPHASGAPHSGGTTTIEVLTASDPAAMQAQEEMKVRFEKDHPGIRVQFLARAASYEDASQQVLRAALIKDLPDVTFQGMNLLRTLVDRHLAVPLDPFLAAAGGADELGLDARLLDLGVHEGHCYGVPFTISTPVIYVNRDLLQAAGVGSEMLRAQDWADWVALGKRVEDPARGITGFYFQWDMTGNWLFQSLDFSNGGRMLSEDEHTVVLDQPAGMRALRTLESFAQAGMPNLPSAQARAAFIAGKIAIFADSSANLAKATTAIGGRFKFETHRFPLPAAQGRLPAGGSVIVMLTRDREKQRAVWKFMEFATGPIGQTIMARHTGYLPVNRIAIGSPELLGNFYANHSNYQASIQQLPVLTRWYAFPGPNSLKIIDVIKGHLESVVSGKSTAANTMPLLVKDVQGLL